MTYHTKPKWLFIIPFITHRYPLATSIVNDIRQVGFNIKSSLSFPIAFSYTLIIAAFIALLKHEISSFNVGFSSPFCFGVLTWLIGISLDRQQRSLSSSYALRTLPLRPSITDNCFRMVPSCHLYAVRLHLGWPWVRMSRRHRCRWAFPSKLTSACCWDICDYSAFSAFSFAASARTALSVQDPQYSPVTWRCLSICVRGPLYIFRENILLQRYWIEP